MSIVRELAYLHVLASDIWFNRTMSTVSCFVDGKPGGAIPVSDRGFLYGHGLFETMRLWEGELPLLEFHLARLAEGARKLSLCCDLDTLRLELMHSLSAFPIKGVVKLILTAGDGRRGYRPHGESKSRCVIQFFELEPSPAIDRLQVCDYRLPHNSTLAGIKHLNRLDQVIAAAELAPGCDGLLLDQEGKVTEALSSNIFVLSGGRWLTPSLSKAGVSGVMRAVLKREVFPALGLLSTDIEMELDILRAAQEVFVCNAVVGITPVAEVAGIRRWSTTPQTESLRAKLAERYLCFSA